RVDAALLAQAHEFLETGAKDAFHATNGYVVLLQRAAFAEQLAEVHAGPEALLETGHTLVCGVEHQPALDDHDPGSDGGCHQNKHDQFHGQGCSDDQAPHVQRFTHYSHSSMVRKTGGIIRHVAEH